MARRLIINADDFGYAEGSVPATIRVREAGVVTSVTALVNQPYWPEAADYLRHHPGLGAGVHLVMNEGEPILPAEQVGSLVDREGRFRDGNALLRRYGRLRVKQLRVEWRAQIERFVSDTGRCPDHLDLHCFYPYVFPSWFRITLELAREYGDCAIRMPFDDELGSILDDWSARTGFPPWLIRWQGWRYRRMVRRFGTKHTDNFESSFSLFVPDENITAEHLLELLDGLPEGSTELLAHPRTQGRHQRDTQALLDPRVKQRIQELGIELITYGDL
jgi:predicted glycoside hydrolase/deacetylase ChbG (UPF0249 family)